MCTVTIVPIERSGIRLACNRDESRRRAPGLPPEERTFGGRRALMPIDPVSDGTWIAVNDAGVAMALLNVYAEPANRAESPRNSTGDAIRSRGTIIPSLLHCSNLAETIAAARDLNASNYPPFKLILADGCGSLADIRSDGTRLAITSTFSNSGPVMFTSSGLGDQVVEGPRRELFERMFTPDSEWDEQQDRFHRHQWPDRPEVSVCMSRAEARTVSLTIVTIEPARVAMSYWGESPDRAVNPVTRTIETHLTIA